MDFPISDLLSEEKSFDWLMSHFHPSGLVCPHCGSIHRIKQMTVRAEIIRYQCKACSGYYTLFTGTIFEGTHYPCSKIVLILRGFAQGETTARLSRELGVDYANLLNLRHRCQANLLANTPETPLNDEVTEADEVFQNAGEKGFKHTDPADPPRKRANKKKDTEPMKPTDPQF